MARYLGLVGIGLLLGLVSAEAGFLGLVLSLVAAIGAYRTSPISRRLRSGGVILASAAATVSLLLRRLVLVDARDPAIGLAPGTQETFLAAVALAMLGLVAVLFGGRPGRSAHDS